MQAIPDSLQEEWHEFLVDRGICPQCLTDRYVFSDRDSQELVCKKCGLVLDVLPREDHTVPGVGRDTHYAPENKVCFGRDLGNPGLDSPRNRRALLQVLAKRDKQDSGLREIQVKNEVMASQESGITQRMKSYLSKWSKQFGWRGNYEFGNVLGSKAEDLGMFLTLRNDGRNSKELSKAAFVLAVHQFFGRDKVREVARELDVEPHYVREAKRIIRFIRKRDYLV